MDKRLVIASIIALVVLVFIFASQKQTSLTEQQIKSEIEKANYCSVKEDCVRVFGTCPFNCNTYLVNKKETSRIETMLRAFVPTEQNLKLCSLMGACIAPTSVECNNNKCEAIYQTKTGIFGTVTLIDGNCRPTTGATLTTCPITKVKVSRTIYIREPATIGNLRYANTNLKLIKQVVSDANGYFEAELPAGTYSVFVEDNSREYCNLFGGQGEACQVTVTAGKMAEFNMDIKYVTTY